MIVWKNNGRLMILLLILLTLSISVSAQATGQFCVRSFDDRNGNGMRDAGEITLQDGIVAELSDATGVVIASALLNDSPTASQGIICFESLEAGQYSIVVTSADYIATTPTTLTVSIQEGDLPSVMEFGAQGLNLQPQVDTVADVNNPEQQLEQVLIATLGALVAAIVMLILGILIYLIFFRGRRRNERNMDYIPPADDDNIYQRPNK